MLLAFHTSVLYSTFRLKLWPDLLGMTFLGFLLNPKEMAPSKEPPALRATGARGKTCLEKAS